MNYYNENLKPEDISVLTILVEHFGITAVQEINGVILSINENDILPSTQEIEAARITVFNNIKARAYKHNRKTNFPSINEQLGMLYDDVDSGVFGELAKNSLWFKTIKNVKQQYPKPE